MKKKILIWVCMLSLFFTLSAIAGDVTISETEVLVGDCLTTTWSGFSGTLNVVIYKDGVFWVYANTNASYQGSQQICTSGWDKTTYKIRVEEKANPMNYNESPSFSVVGEPPHIVDFVINGNSSTTTSSAVFLEINYTSVDGTVTQYMASESSTFSGATWKAFGGSPMNFTLSSTPGNRRCRVLYYDILKLKASLWINSFKN